MDYPELAEYTVMNLFQRLPYASEVVFRWMADEREMFQLCGFLLMARLLMKGEKLNERAEAESVALRKYAHQSRENKRTVSKQLGIWAKSEKPAVRALAEEIKADLEF